MKVSKYMKANGNIQNKTNRKPVRFVVLALALSFGLSLALTLQSNLAMAKGCGGSSGCGGATVTVKKGALALKNYPLALISLESN